VNFSARPDEEILRQKILQYASMPAVFFLAFLRHYFTLIFHDLIGGAIKKR